MSKTRTECGVAIADLQELGINDEGIKKLTALRADYPYLEYTETNEQFGRQRRLKWLFEERRLENQDIAPFACIPLKGTTVFERIK